VESQLRFDQLIGCMETIIPLAEIGHRHTTGQGSSWPFAAIKVILATSNGRYPGTLPGSLTSEVLAGEKLAATKTGRTRKSKGSNNRPWSAQPPCLFQDSEWGRLGLSMTRHTYSTCMKIWPIITCGWPEGRTI
jgi:hypothetical protein